MGGTNKEDVPIEDRLNPFQQWVKSSATIKEAHERIKKLGIVLPKGPKEKEKSTKEVPTKENITGGNAIVEEPGEKEKEKEGINELEATITKKSKGKLKDIVRLDKTIYAFDQMVYRSRVICRRQFKGEQVLSKVYITILISLVTIKDEVSEVGVLLEELRISHLNFEPPLYRRFKGTKDNMKYPGTIRLE